MYHPFPNDRANAIERAQEYVSQTPLFLDTETTGLSNMHEICEIAIVDVEGKVLINTLIKPTKSIDLNASQISGITDEMVAGAPTFRDLLPQLEQILRGRTVLIYNAEFDIAKIARSAEANGIPFMHPDHPAWWWKWVDDPGMIVNDYWHCAMELYAAFYGDWNQYHQSYTWQRLSSAALQCGIELPLGIHRAHQDAELTRLLMLYVAEQNGGGE